MTRFFRNGLTLMLKLSSLTLLVTSTIRSRSFIHSAMKCEKKLGLHYTKVFFRRSQGKNKIKPIVSMMDLNCYQLISWSLYRINEKNLNKIYFISIYWVGLSFLNCSS